MGIEENCLSGITTGTSCEYCNQIRLINAYHLCLEMLIADYIERHKDNIVPEANIIKLLKSLYPDLKYRKSTVIGEGTEKGLKAGEFIIIIQGKDPEPEPETEVYND